jgi:hypothetical protein
VRFTERREAGGHFSEPRSIISGDAPLLTLFEKWPLMQSTAEVFPQPLELVPFPNTFKTQPSLSGC